VKAGAVESTPVSSVDLFPTLLALTGVGPSGAADQLDGVNLLPLLEQSGPIQRDALHWHYPHYSNQGGLPCGALRHGDFKLIQFFEDGSLELYNLRSDLNETNNLARQLPEQANAMRNQLASWRRSQHAQMMEPNPDYVPSESQAAPHVVPQMADGRILLHARNATVHGTTVRYEPQPAKNTIGYWTKLDDWLSWDFEVNEPGVFAAEILQGCGTGSGGSEVLFSVADQNLRMVVQETGGFQNFVSRDIGQFRFSGPGRYTLTVKPKTKPGLAVMDLRSITLQPREQP
jgi:hypothetical protein